VVAALGTAAVTAALLAVREDASKTNVVLAFLLVVVAAAAAGGLGPGTVAALLGFLAFDFLFIPPYRTLIVTDRQDYISLGVYLGIAMVVSYLVGALERRRRQAERREQETRRLYELSTSLVAHSSLDDTLASVVRTVRSLFDLAGCAIVLPEGDRMRVAASDGTVPQALAANVTVQVRGSGTGELQPGQALTVPMRAGSEPVGVLVVVAGGPGSPVFGEAERRTLATFANQAALAVEQGQQEDQRARTRALEEIDRLRTALLNSVSHDLRTPLASIKASASSLLDPEVSWDEEERREFVTTIDQEADRLSRLVHNLLDNARRYAEGSPIALVARERGDTVELRVIDHGPGIPLPERERVFDQFYRLKAGGRRPEGTGMGLAICRGIVAALEGSLRVETTPGGGATFVLSLPAAQRPAVARSG